MWSESYPPDARAAATANRPLNTHTHTHTHTHTQTSASRPFFFFFFFVSLPVCLRQREGERASCTVKPSSTVLRDCPICLSINTQTNTHTHTPPHKLMHTHGPSVVLSDTHGVLHTQWGLSRQFCVFSDVVCEEKRCCAVRHRENAAHSLSVPRHDTEKG